MKTIMRQDGSTWKIGTDGQVSRVVYAPLDTPIAWCAGCGYFARCKVVVHGPHGAVSRELCDTCIDGME